MKPPMARRILAWTPDGPVMESPPLTPKEVAKMVAASVFLFCFLTALMFMFSVVG